MSGSVSLAIEAQRFVYERTNSIALYSDDTETSNEDASPEQSRASSDVTVTISQEAQALLSNSESNQDSGEDSSESTESSPEDGSEKVDDEDSETSKPSTTSDNLTEEEQAEVDELAERDEEVRVHEQAHSSIGGQYAGSPSYSYEQGPDGKRYITDGEVQIDVSPIANDPQATIDKMRQVYRAALAPAEPSSADRSVANEAQQMIAEATADLARSDESSTSKTSTVNSYSRSTLEIDSLYGQSIAMTGAQVNITA